MKIRLKRRKIEQLWGKNWKIMKNVKLSQLQLYMFFILFAQSYFIRLSYKTKTIYKWGVHKKMDTISCLIQDGLQIIPHWIQDTILITVKDGKNWCPDHSEQWMTQFIHKNMFLSRHHLWNVAVAINSASAIYFSEGQFRLLDTSPEELTSPGMDWSPLKSFLYLPKRLHCYWSVLDFNKWPQGDCLCKLSFYCASLSVRFFHIEIKPGYLVNEHNMIQKNECKEKKFVGLCLFF